MSRHLPPSEDDLSVEDGSSELEKSERDSRSGREGRRRAESKDFEVHLGWERGGSPSTSGESRRRHGED